MRKKITVILILFVVILLFTFKYAQDIDYIALYDEMIEPHFYIGKNITVI